MDSDVIDTDTTFKTNEYRPEPAQHEDGNETKKKRLNYTIEFKKEVVQYANLHNMCMAAKKYNVSKQCVHKWKHQNLDEAIIGNEKKRLRGGGRHVDTELYEKLAEWIRERIREQQMVTRTLIQQQAREISGNSQFRASNAWYQRFMIRRGFFTGRTVSSPYIEQLADVYLQELRREGKVDEFMSISVVNKVEKKEEDAEKPVEE